MNRDIDSNISAEDEVLNEQFFNFEMSRDDQNISLAEEAEEFKISFKVHKVLIQRPWMDPAILHYQSLGIMGLEPGTWSTGERNFETNNGSFPLLPKAMVVAKDVEITAKSFSKDVEDQLHKASSNASMKVCPFYECVGSRVF